MDEQDKTIGQRDLESIGDEALKEAKSGVGKALVSLIPFSGELFNSTAPNMYALFKRRAFNEFLSGINIALQQEQFYDKERHQLEDKLQNAENYTYLSSIVDSVFFSKSSRARIILGVITARYISETTIPYEDLILINALKELLDEDIEWFLKIYDVAIGGGREETNGEGAFFFNYLPEQVELNTAFSKMKHLNIFGDKASWLTSKSPNSWHGNVTPITERFKHYIEMVEGKCNDI